MQILIHTYACTHVFLLSFSVVSSKLLLSQTMTHRMREKHWLSHHCYKQSLSPLSASSLYSLTLTRSGEILIYLFLTGSLSHVCVCVCGCSLTVSEAGTFQLHNVCFCPLTHSSIAEIGCPKSVMSREAFIRLSSYSVIWISPTVSRPSK